MTGEEMIQEIDRREYYKERERKNGELLMDIEAEIEDLEARLKEEGQLTEVRWTLDQKGNIIAITIRFIGKID